MQEREFFAKLLEGAGASAGADAGKGGSSSSTTEEGSEAGDEGDDESQVLYFRCRELLEGGREQEEQIDGRNEEEEAAEKAGGSSPARDGAAEIKGGGVLWRRGCFPDIALYELSPIRAATSVAR